ncbi:MAG: alpha-amylase family glycosyl hydrolase, partial [bacterium]
MVVISKKSGNYTVLNGLSNYQEKNKKSKVRFTGHTFVEDIKGNKHHCFYLPTMSNDVKLDVVELKKDANTGNFDYVKTLNSGNIKDTNNPLKIWTPQIDPDSRIGYRFLIKDKPYIDNTQITKINNNIYNVAVNPDRPVLTHHRQMYHIMPDNFNIDEKRLFQNGKEIWRNHFNKYDGTLKDIIPRLDYVKNLGANRILSTPISGKDEISSHGYWTTNPYQISKTLGNINDFKNLQVELFKRGMGWIADGAFVDEGWEGIHLRDLMKWGEKSPFYDWFEVYEPFRKPTFKIGALPIKASSEAYKSFDIKIINSPVDKDGNPSDKYNERKPTSIQLYDKRLVSSQQLKELEEKDKPIRSYAKKQLSNDPGKIRTYLDSVQPLLLEVDPQEVKNKYEAKKNKPSKPKKDNFLVSILRPILNLIGLGKIFDSVLSLFGLADNKSNDKTNGIPRDSLLQWDNFQLTAADHSGGITLWDGNKDIAKLRFMLPKNKEKDLIKNKKYDTKRINQIHQSIAQVQDYITQVGGYWTNEVGKTLTEYTAKKLGETIKNPNLSNEEKAKQIFGSVEKLVKDKVLPENIIKDGNFTKEHIKNILEGSYNFKTSPAPETILDGIMSYPLDAIEFPREISSILSSPYIKKLAKNPDDIGKSRYEIYKDKKQYNTRTNEIYREMDEVYAKDVSGVVKKIINSNSNLKKQLLNEKGDELSEHGKQIFGLIAGDIVKYVTIKALADTNPSNLDKNTNGKTPWTLDYSNIDLEEKIYRDPKQGGIQFLKRSSPEEAAKSIIKSMKEGLVRITDDDKKNFANYLEKRIQGINSDSIKVSKLMIDKLEAGLEWRIDASKDVADMDSVNQQDNYEKTVPIKEGWDEVIKFWKKFNTEVRKHNPRAYIIGEVTDVGSIIKDTKGDKSKTGRYTNGAEAEKLFIDEANFTTQSNYTHLFSSGPKLVHGAPEGFGKDHYRNDNNLIKFLDEKLLDGWGDKEWDKTPGYLYSGPIDNINHSHLATSNHDKPRALHGLTLDIGEFFGNYKNKDEFKDSPKINEKVKRLIELQMSLEIVKSNLMNKSEYANVYKVIDSAFSKFPEKEGDNCDWWTNKKDEEKANFILEKLNEDELKTDKRVGKYLEQDKSLTMDGYKKSLDELRKKANLKTVNIQNYLMNEKVYKTIDLAFSKAGGSNWWTGKTNEEKVSFIVENLNVDVFKNDARVKKYLEQEISLNLDELRKKANLKTIDLMNEKVYKTIDSAFSKFPEKEGGNCDWWKNKKDEEKANFI